MRATQVLKDFAIRGHVLDRKRMENGSFVGEDYFERLLEEIRSNNRSDWGGRRRSLDRRGVVVILRFR